MHQVKSIPAEEITIPSTRQRQEFNPDALAQLSDSISEVGLLHAVVLREGNILVCGQRRIAAIKNLWFTGSTLRYGGTAVPEGLIPCVYIGDLDAVSAEAAELEENIRRVDLTWQERATATARLSALRKAQAVAGGELEPTTAQIAEEVRGSAEGWFQEATRREIIIARHLDRPEVRAAKSLDEAFKVLKRQEETTRNIALAEAVGKTFGAHLHRLVNGDAYDWIRANAQPQFDVVLIDPPFGMGADEFGDSGGRTVGAHAYADGPELWTQLYTNLPALALLVTKPQAHFYSFCDIDGFHALRVAMENVGWWVHRTPIVWHKPNAVRVPWPEHGPQRKYELILYAVKGKRPVTKIAPDVISCPTDENLGHSAQKPVALYIDLLKRSVQPGNQVLDCFCGTGTIFPAAHELKCIAMGVEKDAGAYGIAIKRLEALKAQGELL